MSETEKRERPHETAQWAYIGEWVEFDVGPYRRYRYRRAEADDGSWSKVVVEHETRNGWGNVGKKTGEGIDIGRELEARGLPRDRYDWTTAAEPPSTPDSPPDSEKNRSQPPRSHP